MKKFPGGRLLSNGRYATLVTRAGGGASWCGEILLTRWRADPLQDAGGLILFLRDLETGRFWRLAPGRAPGEPPGDVSSRWRPGRLELTRVVEGLESRVDIGVAPWGDFELRRVRLTNHSPRPRRVELTAFTEVVLNTAAAHAGHPVFSSLFLQAEHEPESGALFIQRRPRSKDEKHPWLVGALIGAPRPEIETDRARFVGRGRTLFRPRALLSREPLSGRSGSLLDPAVALRGAWLLEPGQSIESTAVLGLSGERETAAAWLAALRCDGAVEAALLAAGTQAVMRLEPEPPTPAGAEHDAPVPGPPPFEEPPSQPRPEAGARRDAEPLLMFNGYGGFSADGREYVIRLPFDGEIHRRPPRPWINVVANPDFGFMVSETGSICTWSMNSREHRLSPWNNDPLLDPHEEALYLRDEESGGFWSLMPGPAPCPADYEVRHGFGYTTCRLTSAGLDQETRLFVSPEDPVRFARIRVDNRSGRPRRLSLYAYTRLVLGGTAEETGPLISTGAGPGPGSLLARNPVSGEFPDRVTFASVVTNHREARPGVTADRAFFLGRHGGTARPEAVVSGRPLDGVTGGPDPCFAQQVSLHLEAGDSVEVVFILGDAGTGDLARELVARHATIDDVSRADIESQARWSEGLSRLRIETPRPGLDLLMNGWLAYQTLGCRLWARSAFYQSGGAFGFRDQIQDAGALVYHWPEITRAQIARHAGQQFVEGDVLHWWHPPGGAGIRTRFADDLLWLPYMLAFYIRATGDWSLLEERVGYLRARRLEPGEDEAYLRPEDSGEAGDLYEHACRAIDRSLDTGSHGLPLFGTGDWNDGMNRVGREGRGESVWMGFFLHSVLADFLALCARRGDLTRMETYRRHMDGLRAAVNEAGWDGEWYRRGFFDSGAPLGSRQADECRIDVLAQAWAVLSGAAPSGRAVQAMDAAERELVDEDRGLILLLRPAFDRMAEDPGYIKGYVPGVRENGGQYTHAALWMVRAAAALGRNDRAARWLEMIGPLHHSRTPEDVEVYQVEPYVVAADIYGAPPHVGRGGWTWYTGSAGWMLRVGLESILGLELLNGRELRLKPCVPDDWPGFRLTWRMPGHETHYDIEARNPRRQGLGVMAAWHDGRAARVEDGAARIRLDRDGGRHRIELELGSGPSSGTPAP